MANNPIDTGDFKYFLEFSYGRLEVAEPVGFDASNFVLEQDRGRLGRDTYFGNDEINLKFLDDVFEPITTPNILNDGTLVYHLTSGLNELLNENKQFGSEAKVNFILQKNGLDFTVGELDFGAAKTDRVKYFETNIIQNGNLAKYKRHEKTPINLFSDKDIEGNTITPINTFKVLFEAKPVTQISKWNAKTLGLIQESGQAFSYGVYIPLVNTLVNFGLEDSFAPFDVSYGLFEPDSQTITDRLSANKLLTARFNLQNVTIKIKNLTYSSFRNIGSTDLYIWTSEGTTFLSNNSSVTNQDFEINIPSINAGVQIGVFVSVFYSANNLFSYNLGFDNFSCDGVEITATSIGYSSVVNAVRYIDLIKQNYKAIGNLPVNAPHFDVGGVDYNNCCFNGKLIRQITDEPFTVSLKDTIESFSQEFGGDFQINENEVFVGKYRDFYQNNDLGGFLSLPDVGFEEIKNDKYLINGFTFSYEKYENDRDEDNTLDAIHTESKWLVPQEHGENEKKVSCNFIRDAYKGESIRRRSTQKTTTADQSDDDILIYDFVSLAPNSRRKIALVFNFQALVGQYLKISAPDTFRWDLLGFKVGDILIIYNGSVTTNYTVIAIEPKILTLNYFGSVSETGTNYFEIDYPLTDVNYVIRTNQGLISSENLLNANNYGNLRYSIKRNILNNWSEYLATCGKFIPSKSVENTYFKANGECTTYFLGDFAPIKENENFSFESIASKKIINQNIIKTTVIAEFEEVKELLENMQAQRGFVRVSDYNGAVIKGYVIKLDYTWKFKEMVLELEERNESDFLTVNYNGSTLTIQEVGYDLKMVQNKTYNIFNDYIQFFDEKNIPLCNRTLFSDVLFNGVTYNNVNDLVSSIENV